VVTGRVLNMQPALRSPGLRAHAVIAEERIVSISSTTRP